jgi:hypothetical protein
MRTRRSSEAVSQSITATRSSSGMSSFQITSRVVVSMGGEAVASSAVR